MSPATPQQYVTFPNTYKNYKKFRAVWESENVRVVRLITLVRSFLCLGKVRNIRLIRLLRIIRSFLCFEKVRI